MPQADILSENIEEARSAIAAVMPPAQIGLVLGSGLGGVVDRLSDVIKMPYLEVPHFPEGQVEGHAGFLVSGVLAGKRVLVMQGRFHYYEGYTMQGVVFPIRVMAALAVKRLVVTNAAGGLKGRLRPGDFVVVEDHLNFMGTNPLIGPNIEGLGPRFVDMGSAYSPDLVSEALTAARRLGLRAGSGVMAAVSGPTYETPAEAAFLRAAGADIVTMSTVPEVIAARHAGMQVLCLSCVTNVHGRRSLTTHEDVLAVCAGNAERLASWLELLVQSWKKTKES